MSEDGLLFLVGRRYLGFVDASGKSISDHEKRRLVCALKDRGMITPERYEELREEL